MLNAKGTTGGVSWLSGCHFVARPSLVETSKCYKFEETVRGLAMAQDNESSSPQVIESCQGVCSMIGAVRLVVHG